MTTEPVSKARLAEQYQNSTNLEARISVHERFRVNPYGWQRWLFDQLALPAEAAILEVGCGPGLLWRQNSERIPAGWRITLSDSSAGMVDKARQNMAAIPAGVTYAVADVSALPFPASSFEAVIANHVLYYAGDEAGRSRAIAGLRRLLRTGGHFYASTNGLTHMLAMVKLVSLFDPTLPFVTPIIRNFSLEDGPRQVAVWLGDVDVLRYEDALVVDDVDALISFVLSASTVFGLPAARTAALSAFIRRWMAENGGVIIIQKDAGIIRARRIE